MSKRIIRLLLVLVAMGAALALLTLSTGRANAEPADNVFLMTLSEEHVADQYTNSELVQLGRQICDELAQGYSAMNISIATAKVYKLTYWDSSFLTGAAVGSYCPQFYDKIMGGASSRV